MNIYVLNSVVDNPLFEGLALSFDKYRGLLNTAPADWRANYKTWKPRLLKPTWVVPDVQGNVRRFNDFPCVNLAYPAFSERAVDTLRDLLEPNGELLPIRHTIGTYYFYNCYRMTNCVDLSKSKATKTSGGFVTSTDHLVFVDAELTSDLVLFKVRTQLLEVFCSQQFVDRVETAGLQGFVFVPIWPMPKGMTYNDQRFKASQMAKKWRPNEVKALDIKANTLVLRLYCEKKKPSKKELADAESVMAHLENSLYDANQANAESYFGNVEGQDVVDYEIRVFLSAPNCDRLIQHVMPSLQSLPWPGKFHVVKRRGEFTDAEAREEYVPVH